MIRRGRENISLGGTQRESSSPFGLANYCKLRKLSAKPQNFIGISTWVPLSQREFQVGLGTDIGDPGCRWLYKMIMYTIMLS